MLTSYGWATDPDAGRLGFWVASAQTNPLTVDVGEYVQARLGITGDDWCGVALVLAEQPALLNDEETNWIAAYLDTTGRTDGPFAGMAGAPNPPASGRSNQPPRHVDGFGTIFDDAEVRAVATLRLARIESSLWRAYITSDPDGRTGWNQLGDDLSHSIEPDCYGYACLEWPWRGGFSTAQMRDPRGGTTRARA